MHHVKQIMSDATNNENNKKSTPIITGLANNDSFGRLCTPNCIVQLFYRLPFFRQAILSAAAKIASLSNTDDAPLDEKEVKNQQPIIALAELFQQMMKAESSSVQEEPQEQQQQQEPQKQPIVASPFGRRIASLRAGSNGLLPDATKLITSLCGRLDHFDFSELMNVLIFDGCTKSKIGQEMIQPVVDLYFGGVSATNLHSIDKTYSHSRHSRCHTTTLPSKSATDATSLHDLLKLYTDPETVDDVWCDYEDGHRESKTVDKHEAINRCPSVFLIHSPRFYFDMDTMSFSKKTNEIQFPVTAALGGLVEKMHV